MKSPTDKSQKTEGSEPADEDHLTREEYFAERHLLIEARQRGYQRVEQLVTGGAAGALVLSITFLEKIAPGPSVRESEWLIGAWILLLGTLGLTLFGQYSSAKSFECEMSALDARVNGESVPDNWWATCNMACGMIGNLLFVVGIALLARFAYINAPFQPRG
jgi:hypothetical protein